MIELFNRYGVRGTFHLNGINYIDKSDEELLKVRELYRGHEIACHTMHHGWLNKMSGAAIVREVYEERKILEKIAGYPVVGMSYPSGAYSDEAVQALRACGIVYSRTVESAEFTDFPENFLKWNPTCHHRDAVDLCSEFLENLDSQWTSQIMYIWGHSHELVDEEQWQYMEKLLKMISKNDKIWYATNIEIYDYMCAQRRLRLSADESMIHNPSSIPVWVEVDKMEKVCVPAGETVFLK